MYPKHRKYYLVALLMILYLQLSKAQNIYGISGAIKTPDAYTVSSGDIFVGGSYGFDYFNFSSAFKGRQIENWSGFANVGVHSRIEMGVRVIGFPEAQVNSQSFEGTYIDRNVSGKFIVIKEKDIFPQLSLGVQDAIGTRYFHGSYLVASKRLEFGERKMYLTSSLGYGFILPSSVLRVSDYKLEQLFGNIVFSPHRSTLILGEYSREEINLGLRLNFKRTLYFQINYQDVQYLGASMYVKFKL